MLRACPRFQPPLSNGGAAFNQTSRSRFATSSGTSKRRRRTEATSHSPSRSSARPRTQPPFMSIPARSTATPTTASPCWQGWIGRWNGAAAACAGPAVSGSEPLSRPCPLVWCSKWRIDMPFSRGSMSGRSRSSPRSAGALAVYAERGGVSERPSDGLAARRILFGGHGRLLLVRRRLRVRLRL